MKPGLQTNQFIDQTILITGGCGFIGTNLAKFLGGYGYRIKVVDNLSTGTKDNLLSSGYHIADADLVIGDVRDRDKLEKLITGADAVVHLAAHTRVLESLANPEQNWDINTRGTANVLETCRTMNVKTFIFASSNVAVGQQTPPIDEAKIPKPISPYGASKLAGEALTTAYHFSYDLNTVSLRFANCYGPHSEHKTSVIAHFIKQAMRGEPLVIYGDGNQTRDFIHVDDICRSILLCLRRAENNQPEQKKIWGETFQIASGKETTINSLAKMIIGVTQKNVEIIYQPKRQGEIERNYSNITKARKLLGFHPEVELSNGLGSLWNWFYKGEHS